MHGVCESEIFFQEVLDSIAAIGITSMAKLMKPRRPAWEEALSWQADPVAAARTALKKKEVRQVFHRQRMDARMNALGELKQRCACPLWTAPLKR
ncbi:MAG: hypothetical protein J5828_02020, partial [Desulfovibrionaceae bacterium]|nr:hypothetical protein [Desulfovibrionaceae bacterium]